MLAGLRTISINLKTESHDLYLDELKRIGNEADRHNLLLSKSAGYYKKRYQYTNIPIGLITKALSLPIIISLIKNYLWIRYLSLVLTVITAGLVWLQNYLEYEKSKGKCLHASYLYRKMSRKIQDFLLDCRVQADQSEIDKFLDQIRDELDHIIDLKVDIPENIIKNQETRETQHIELQRPDEYAC